PCSAGSAPRPTGGGSGRRCGRSPTGRRPRRWGRRRRTGGPRCNPRPRRPLEGFAAPGDRNPSTAGSVGGEGAVDPLVGGTQVGGRVEQFGQPAVDVGTEGGGNGGIRAQRRGEVAGAAG